VRTIPSSSQEEVQFYPREHQGELREPVGISFT
jgi:hypothetical protein